MRPVLEPGFRPRWCNGGAMQRIPLTVRALVLLPLLALGVDHARASLACGPQALIANFKDILDQAEALLA